MSKIQVVGLDVHAETIAVAVAEAGGEVRSLGTIPNRLQSIRKLFVKLPANGKLKVCYEAGPTGYVLYWQLTQLGVPCEVIAPSLIPTKAAIASRPIAAMPKSSPAVTGPANSPPSGFPMPNTKRCETSSGPPKRPRKIS